MIMQIRLRFRNIFFHLLNYFSNASNLIIGINHITPKNGVTISATVVKVTVR